MTDYKDDIKLNKIFNQIVKGEYILTVDCDLYENILNYGQENYYQEERKKWLKQLIKGFKDEKDFGHYQDEVKRQIKAVLKQLFNIIKKYPQLKIFHQIIQLSLFMGLDKNEIVEIYKQQEENLVKVYEKINDQLLQVYFFNQIWNLMTWGVFFGLYEQHFLSKGIYQKGEVNVIMTKLSKINGNLLQIQNPYFLELFLKIYVHFLQKDSYQNQEQKVDYNELKEFYLNLLKMTIKTQIRNSLQLNYGKSVYFLMQMLKYETEQYKNVIKELLQYSLNNNFSIKQFKQCLEVSIEQDEDNKENKQSLDDSADSFSNYMMTPMSNQELIENKQFESISYPENQINNNVTQLSRQQFQQKLQFEIILQFLQMSLYFIENSDKKKNYYYFRGEQSGIVADFENQNQSFSKFKDGFYVLFDAQLENNYQGQKNLQSSQNKETIFTQNCLMSFVLLNKQMEQYQIKVEYGLKEKTIQRNEYVQYIIIKIEQPDKNSKNNKQIITQIFPLPENKTNKNLFLLMYKKDRNKFYLYLNGEQIVQKEKDISKVKLEKFEQLQYLTIGCSIHYQPQFEGGFELAERNFEINQFFQGKIHFMYVVAHKLDDKRIVQQYDIYKNSKNDFVQMTHEFKRLFEHFKENVYFMLNLNCYELAIQEYQIQNFQQIDKFKIYQNYEQQRHQNFVSYTPLRFKPYLNQDVKKKKKWNIVNKIMGSSTSKVAEQDIIEPKIYFKNVNFIQRNQFQKLLLSAGNIEIFFYIFEILEQQGKIVIEQNKNQSEKIIENLLKVVQKLCGGDKQKYQDVFVEFMEPQKQGDSFFKSHGNGIYILRNLIKKYINTNGCSQELQGFYKEGFQKMIEYDISNKNQNFIIIIKGMIESVINDEQMKMKNRYNEVLDESLNLLVQIFLYHDQYKLQQKTEKAQDQFQNAGLMGYQDKVVKKLDEDATFKQNISYLQDKLPYLKLTKTFQTICKHIQQLQNYYDNCEISMLLIVIKRLHLVDKQMMHIFLQEIVQIYNKLAEKAKAYSKYDQIINFTRTIFKNKKFYLLFQVQIDKIEQMDKKIQENIQSLIYDLLYRVILNDDEGSEKLLQLFFQNQQLCFNNMLYVLSEKSRNLTQEPINMNDQKKWKLWKNCIQITFYLEYFISINKDLIKNKAKEFSKFLNNYIKFLTKSNNHIIFQYNPTPILEELKEFTDLDINESWKEIQINALENGFKKNQKQRYIPKPPNGGILRAILSILKTSIFYGNDEVQTSALQILLQLTQDFLLFYKNNMDPYDCNASDLDKKVWPFMGVLLGCKSVQRHFKIQQDQKKSKQMYAFTKEVKKIYLIYILHLCMKFLVKQYQNNELADQNIGVAMQISRFIFNELQSEFNVVNYSQDINNENGIKQRCQTLSNMSNIREGSSFAPSDSQIGDLEQLKYEFISNFVGITDYQWNQVPQDKINTIIQALSSYDSLKNYFNADNEIQTKQIFSSQLSGSQINSSQSTIEQKSLKITIEEQDNLQKRPSKNNNQILSKQCTAILQYLNNTSKLLSIYKKTQKIQIKLYHMVIKYYIDKVIIRGTESELIQTSENMSNFYDNSSNQSPLRQNGSSNTMSNSQVLNIQLQKNEVNNNISTNNKNPSQVQQQKNEVNPLDLVRNNMRNFLKEIKIVEGQKQNFEIKIDIDWKRLKKKIVKDRGFWSNKQENQDQIKLYKVDKAECSSRRRYFLKIDKKWNKKNYKVRNGSLDLTTLAVKSRKVSEISYEENVSRTNSITTTNTENKSIQMDNNNEKQEYILSIQEQNEQKDEILYRSDCEYITQKGSIYGELQIRSKQTLFISTGKKRPESRNYIWGSTQLIQTKKQKQWNNIDIKKIFSRRFNLKDMAIEFQTKENKFYFFTFYEPAKQKEVFQAFQKHSLNYNIKDRNIEKKQDRFQYKEYEKKWAQGKISNFQYLMLVNTYAGRSLNDLSQYFIFPWILKKYSGSRQELDLSNSENYRRLDLPIGQQNQQRYEKDFLQRFEDAYKEYQKEERNYITHKNQVFNYQQKLAKKLDKKNKQIKKDKNFAAIIMKRQDTGSQSQIDTNSERNSEVEEIKGNELSESKLLKMQSTPNNKLLQQQQQSQLDQEIESMQEEYNRYKQAYMDSYEQLNIYRDQFCHYRTHYSSAPIVYGYLIRLEPFSSLHHDFQGGKFDVGDRLFHNIIGQWTTCTTNTGDVRELIPEFYFMPDFLINKNKLDLGQQQNGTYIDNVKLPEWVETQTADEFVFTLREALESRYVSKYLHKWIDLIFGVNNGQDQQQKRAIENGNLFRYLTYIDSLNILEEKDPEGNYLIQDQLLISNITQIQWWGVCPDKLFSKEHRQKEISREKSYLNSIIQKDCFSSSPVEQMDLLFYYEGKGIVKINKNNTLTIYNMKFGIHNKDPKIKKIGSENIDQTLKFQSGRKNQFAFFENKLFIAGYSGISCKIINFDFNEKRDKQSIIDIGNHHYEFTTCLDVGKNLLCIGSRDCRISVFKLQNLQSPTPETILYGHHSEIVAIRIDKQLNIIVSIDIDGLLIIHNAKSYRFFKNIKLDINDENIQQIEVHQFGYIFVLTHRQMFLYSLNGELFWKILIKDLFYKKENNNCQITDAAFFSDFDRHLYVSTNVGKIFKLDIFKLKLFYQKESFQGYQLQELKPINNQGKENFGPISSITFYNTDKIKHKTLICGYQNGIIQVIKKEKQGQQIDHIRNLN